MKRGKGAPAIAIALAALAMGSCAGRKTAPAAAARPPKARSLDLQPALFTLAGKWSAQQILVTGAGVDLTARAKFRSAAPRIAAVSPSGLVTPVSGGSTTIIVSAGGAKASVAVTVKDARTAAAGFVNHVHPALSRLGCNSVQCHGAQRGKGGLSLSLFGADPQADFDAITRAAAGRRINRLEPGKSLLLAKAAGALLHAGAKKLPPGSPEHEMFVSWLASGAPWSLEKEPRIVSLKVFPPGRSMVKGDSQQLLATAVFSDGTERDVTRDAVFQSGQPDIAALQPGGRITAAGFGETAVVVTYARRAAVARITVPQPLDRPFPALHANNRIDELVDAKLRTLGIPPSGPIPDEVFLRRVYLDVIGLLPTPAEARRFTADSDPRKRARLIDRLLERDEFADFWALKWGDLLRIKSEYPVRIWPKAVAVYYRWVRESIARNRPYDEFVRELLVSSGSNFRDAACNFYRAVPNKDPQTFGETAALVFMGARLSCARCHGHPTESWSLDDDLGFGAFFSRLNFKSTLEWKEEIVFADPRRSLRHPKTKDIVKPKYLGGDAIDVGPEEDPRMKFAAWLTAPGNPWFARNIVNRIWFWLLGRGIIHEPDDVRPTNPPENPDLLAFLEKELTTHNYDLKHIYRLILNSRTYQASSIPNAGNAKDRSHFSHYLARRLAAEQMLDAVSQVTGTWERFLSRIPEPYSYWPAGLHASQLSDGNVESNFLELFGRPPRDTPYEEERKSDVSLRQVLYFINSEQLDGKIANSPVLKRLLAPGRTGNDTVEEIYLSTLSRFPTAEESARLAAYLAKNKSNRRQAIQDLLWAVMNSKEFVFNH